MRFSRNSLRKVALIVVCLAPAGLALARAGGGGGFHSSGHSSSHSSGGHHFSSGSGHGSSGSGADLMELVYWIMRLTFVRPAVGVPLDLLIVVAVIWMWRRAQRDVPDSVWKNATDDHPGAAEGLPSRLALVQAGLAALKERDPAFDEVALARRIGAAFITIQQEWTARRLDRVAHLTTDGVRERFQILLDLERDRGIANVTRDVHVPGVQIVEAKADRFYETLTVRIDASAVDYHVRAGTDQVVYGSQQASSFAEYWTLLRKPGARSGTGPGLMEGHCPSCGAPLQLTDKGTCAYCTAVVHSGAFDWVLSGIQQTSVADGHHRAVAGLEALTARDPGFNVAYVEDRASLIFWRLRAAEARGTPAPLAKVATPEFTAAHRQDASDGTFACDAAVGSVELVAVQPGDAGEPDLLHVRVKWSGRPVKAKLPAFLPPRFEECVLFDEDFVLERASGAVTAAEQGLRSAHCPSCGAPETTDDSTVCGSCGAALASGALDWVLSDVKAYTPIQGYRPPETEDVIATAALVLQRSGGPSERELQLLLGFADQRGLAPARLQQVIRSVMKGQARASLPASTEERRRFLKALLALCVMDGELSADEEALFRGLAAKVAPLGFDAEAALRAARTRLGA